MILICAALVGLIVGMILSSNIIVGISVLLAGCFFMTFSAYKNSSLILVITLFCWVMLSPLLLRYIHIPMGNYIDEVLVFLLVLKAIVTLKNAKVTSILSRETALIGSFCFIVVVNSVFQGQSITTITNFMFSYIKWILVGWGTSRVLHKNEFKVIFKVILFIAVLETIISGIQFCTFGRANIFVGNEIHIQQDAATGTLGIYGAHYLGNFLIMACILFVGIYHFSQEKKWLIGIAVSLIGFFITFTEISYLFLFPCVIAVVILSKKIAVKYKVILMVVGVSLLSVLGASDLEIGKRIVEKIKDPKEIQYSGKFKSMVLASDLIRKDCTYTLLGYGAGSYSSGAAVKSKNPLFVRYIKRLYETVLSTYDFYWASFSTLLVETGLIGTILYYSTILTITMGCFFQWVAYRRYDDEKAYMNIMFCVLSIFMMFLSVLYNSFELLVYVVPYGVLYGAVRCYSEEMPVAV